MVMKSIYQKENLFQDEYTLKAWYELLKDLPYQFVNMALMKWMQTNKWSPSVAEIREATAEIMNEEIPGVEDAWEKVRLIARDYSPYDIERTEKQLEELDDITRRCVKLTDIRTLAYTDSIDIARAHFINRYKELAMAKKSENQTAENIRTAIEAMQPKPEAIETEQRVGVPVFNEPERENSAFHEELRQRFLVQV